MGNENTASRALLEETDDCWWAELSWAELQLKGIGTGRRSNGNVDSSDA